jgi:hydroxyethylthiazole kinase-like uncharacterized protein yjeF
MAELDRRARNDYAIPELSLIEAAGVQADAEIRMRFGPAPGRPVDGTVYVVARGNNAADALVMARHAHADGATALHLVQVGEPPRAGSPAAVHLAACVQLGIPVSAGDSTGATAAIAGAVLLVEALCGSGVRGALRGAHLAAVELLNAARAPVVSLDLPCGMADDPPEGGDSSNRPAAVVSATLTLAMGLPKRSLYLPRHRQHAGDVVVLSCGFPSAILQAPAARSELLLASALPEMLPQWADDVHKGSRGHLGILAGCAGTPGAARLAADAAARTGAGLVTVLSDAEVVASVAAGLPSVMCRDVTGIDPPQLGALLSGCTAVAVGPGWGTSEARMVLLTAVLETTSVGGVLDADGLNLLARLRAIEGQPRDLQGRWVLTPHPAELARLLDSTVAAVLAAPAAAAAAAASAWHATVVIKGHVPIVVDGDRESFIDQPNAALATGGSGDVLAGVVGALLAGGCSPGNAGRGAVLLHAEAGRRARQERGWFLAEDLPVFIGRVAEHAMSAA